jgi:hypothetical protein
VVNHQKQIIPQNPLFIIIFVFGWELEGRLDKADKREAREAQRGCIFMSENQH